MVALEFSDPAEWVKRPTGFVDDEDPDYDPAFDMPAAPPVGWERLPMHEEVTGGE